MPNDFFFDPDAVDLISGCLVDGAIVPGDGEPFEIVRPSDGRLVRTERSASAALVDRAVSLARASHASGIWADATAQQRARVFRRWAELVEAHAHELLPLEVCVSTRLGSEFTTRDVAVTVALIRYYGEMLDKVEGDVYASAADVWSLGVYEPYGVVATISPWNVPLLLATTKIAPALAAGNAVIIKPSEFTPYAVLRVMQLAIEAGVPARQIAVLPGVGGETGNAIVIHPDVDYVAFTGSTATGQHVMAAAAMAGPKPVSLEMGGKSPQVVFADADLDAVATLVANSVVRNAGQICYAGTRLVIDAKVADDMVERVSTRIRKVEPGPTWSKQTTLAPIISLKQRDRITQILADGVALGAEAVVGGAAYDTNDSGFFFKPTIMRSMAVDNPIIQKEVFGPVLAVQPFTDLEEALVLADHRDYGLGAAVYTRDLATAMKCSRAIKSGSVWINNFGVNDIIPPVGGYKKSGFGKDFGMDGLLKFMHVKSIIVRASA